MQPVGWFQIGWTDQFALGDVTPLQYFGHELVAFRGPSGELTVLNAHCQHLGAHLAYGGCVTAEGIRCPFHGWEWDTEGRNIAIPFSSRTNKARRIRSWPVVEKDSVAYLWHDVDEGKPQWEVPALFIDLGRAVEGKVFDRPYPAGTGRFESVRVHPQMVLENAVDPTHFRFVHGTPDVPVLLSQEVTANEWRSLVGFGKRWAACPPVDSERRGTLTILFSGVGIGFNALVDQESTVVVLIATTPVDAERSDLFQTVWVQEVSGEAPQSHDDRRINALAALPQDLTIWEHQRYLNPAGLSREEVRGFNEIRRWGARFYPDPAVSTTRSGRLADRPSPPRA